jgi:hypothetical protein
MGFVSLMTRVWFRGFGRPDRRKILGGVGEEGAGEVVRTCGAVPFGVRASRLPLRLGLLEGTLDRVVLTACSHVFRAGKPGGHLVLVQARRVTFPVFFIPILYTTGILFMV